jgi:hypothetical protein
MMNGNNFFKRLVQWFRRSSRSVKPEMALSHGHAETVRMLQMLQQTEAIELSCDEVFAKLDEYTEMALKGEEVAHLMPLVKQHLDMCPDCREEYEALVQILTAPAAAP